MASTKNGSDGHGRSGMQHPIAPILRASKGFRVLPLERLSETHRSLLPDASDPHLYGIAEPLQPGGRPKSITTDVALILLSLDSPGPIPAFLKARYGDEAARDLVTELVLEGLLDVEVDGQFCSGAAGMRGLASPPSPLPAQGASALAIQHALRMYDTSPGALMLYLYTFNRMPDSSTARARWPDDVAVQRHLGIEMGGTIEKLLADKYVATDPQAGWRRWRRAKDADVSAHVKLYLSVTPLALAGALATIAPRMPMLAPVAFKVAATRADLLRPDKLVFYFPDCGSARAAAGHLDRLLNSLPGHEVPFTASFSTLRRATWGADPPALRGSQLAGLGSSWRLWVCERLAAAICDGHAQGLRDDSLHGFVSARLLHGGIDTAAWAPIARLEG